MNRQTVGMKSNNMDPMLKTRVILFCRNSTGKSKDNKIGTKSKEQFFTNVGVL